MLSLPTKYTLPTNCPVRWTAAQQRSLANDFPLPGPSSIPSTPDFLKSVYSQFLWLPESITPLTQLIPSIQRAFPPPPADAQEELKALESLLLTPRQCSEKYDTRIPDILVSGAEGLDDDLNMMGYAFRNEKPIHSEDECPDGEDEDEAEERWRKAWLERVERREVQIQILLHFFLLQYPRPPLDVKKTKGKNSAQRDRWPTDAPLEDRLESMMDKLAMWQLLSSIDKEQDRRGQMKGKGKVDDERDWMQRFCQDIVQPTFSKSLPDDYALLYSKVFPHTLFSSSSSDDDEHFTRPPASPKPRPRHPQPKKPLPPERIKDTDSIQSRSRSRSLSKSLEAERRANSSVAAGASRKRVLSREVSMSKVFKRSRVNQPEVTFVAKKAAPDKGARVNRGAPAEHEVILVENTPVKAPKRQQKIERAGSDAAIVEMDVDESGRSSVLAPSTPVVKGGNSSRLIDRFLMAQGDDDDDEGASHADEEWMVELPSLQYIEFVGS